MEINWYFFMPTAKNALNDDKTVPGRKVGQMRRKKPQEESG